MKGKLIGLLNYLNNTEEKGCFYANNDDVCSSTIANAHSLSKEKVLSKIAENGCVMSFDRNDETPKKIGYRKATTFKGFCKKHDGILFKPIDDYDYEIGNKEQEFLFAYRVLAKTYYDKKTNKKKFERLHKLLIEKDYETLNQYGFSGITPDDLCYMAQRVSIMLQGINKGIDSLEYFKKAMNINLKNKNYYKIQTKVIEFNKEYRFAASLGITLDNDINGRVVNDYTSPLKPLYLTVFPQGGKSYILLSYHQKNKDTFKFIEEHVLNQPPNKQKVIISNAVIAYGDNFVLSPSMYNNHPQRDLIKKTFQDFMGVRPSKLIFNDRLNIFLD